jgi:hypothetical protein
MNRLKRVFLVVWIAVGAGAPLAAAAGPVAGVGLHGGAIAAGETGIHSRGLVLGADIQFLASRDWSLNPYLDVSAERGNQGSSHLSDVISGLQIRRWMDDAYVGVHISSHARLLSAGGTSSTRYSLLAPGFVAGFEPTGGWGAMLQVDVFEPAGFSAYSAGNAWRHAVKLNLVYRMK